MVVAAIAIFIEMLLAGKKEKIGFLCVGMLGWRWGSLP